MPRNRKVIYLTFDDGPIPVVTPWVLKTLKEFDARATFFCIGDNVRKNEAVFDEVISAGHAVGNHTFNHLRGTATPDAEYIANIRQCADRVQTDLFRPPYGRIRRSQVNLLKASAKVSTEGIALPQTIVMWDVLSGDFDEQLSPEKCLQNVLRHTEAGSIVVFHDSLKAFPRLEYVLPRVLKKWREMGYGFEVL